METDKRPRWCPASKCVPRPGDHHHAHDGHHRHPGLNYGHYYDNYYGNRFGYSHFYDYSSYAFIYERTMEVCHKVWSKKRHRQILICSTYYQY